MILVIDNYDSFTYNIVQYLGEMGAELRVVRNRDVTLDEVGEMRPEKILISPGPCTPNEAGISVGVIQRFGPEIPILGVCLGHQSIAAALGGNVVRAERIMHGKTSMVRHDGAGVFEGLPNPMECIRYHSLIIERSSLPDCLTISADTDQGEIMGVRHKDWPLEGVQFHPESILTQGGKDLLRNFLTQEL
ncbi:MAG TPA: aminodeoxychorismate/anthranilate synthase component II [Armatimonadota bacterium]|jgi:anthranilate synthase/aminodeoxychorismate synthase-like glutamine amidotransferase